MLVWVDACVWGLPVAGLDVDWDWSLKSLLLNCMVTVCVQWGVRVEVRVKVG